MQRSNQSMIDDRLSRDKLLAICKMFQKRNEGTPGVGFKSAENSCLTVKAAFFAQGQTCCFSE